jgi:putative FmdB family regulatory protein
MPTYEYECDACAHRFETVQRMSDAPLTECPECGKHIRRVLSAGIGIAFKGSGFYANDKSKKAEKPAAKAPAADKACAAAKATTTAEKTAACAACPAATAAS